MMLDMDHMLMVLLVLVWSTGLHAKEIHNVPVRLVGGSSRCAGTLEVQYYGHWSGVDGFYWTAKEAAVVCRKLDCGSLVSVDRKKSTANKATLKITSLCVYPERTVHDCIRRSSSSSVNLEIICSDSVRLLDGTSLCSGRLEVKSAQSDQRWSSVCEADFDQQDAEVVCRELGCGAPSVLQGALYGEVEAPTWTKEFQCGGNESALLDCRSSDSVQTSCPSGRAVRLTCSEPVRLVGGDSRCAGTLELKQGEWRPVSGYDWTVKEAAVFCKALDCGSAVSIEQRNVTSWVRTWWTYSHCVQSGSTLKDCVLPSASKSIFNLTCSAADKVGQVV